MILSYTEQKTGRLSHIIHRNRDTGFRISYGGIKKVCNLILYIEIETWVISLLTHREVQNHELSQNLFIKEQRSK